MTGFDSSRYWHSFTFSDKEICWLDGRACVYFIVTHAFAFVAYLHSCLQLCLLHMGGHVLRLQESSDLGIALQKETLIPGLIVSYLFYNERVLTGLLGFGFSFLCSLGHTKFLLRNWCALLIYQPHFLLLTSLHQCLQATSSSSWPLGMPCTVELTHVCMCYFLC